MSSKVTLRRKPISKGRESLYLEYYPAIRDPETMKLVYKEFLGIYIYQNPQDQIERDYNDEILMKAEAIRAIRVQAIINEKFASWIKISVNLISWYILKILLKKRIRNGCLYMPTLGYLYRVNIPSEI